MATKPIKGSEIIEVGALDNHIQQLKELKVLYETLDKDVLKFATESKKAAKGFKASNNEDVKRAIQLEKQLTAEIVEQEKRKQALAQTNKTLQTLEQQKERTLQQQIASEGKLADAIGKEEQMLKKKTTRLREEEKLKQDALNTAKKQLDLNDKQIRQQKRLEAEALKLRKAKRDENNAYKQQSKTLTDLINRYQNLAARGRENGKVARGMLVEITKLDTGLKKIDATVGRHQRNVGNYQSALTGLGKTYRSIIGLASQFGIAMGGAMIVRNSINIIKDFEQANANLAAILGTTADQTKNLQEQQLQLGGSTSFTAAQVAELQTEFAKLGFTQNEITQATEGTLFLAKAAGTDLANAAEISGSTLRAFNLDVSEMGRVTDVMAKSFSTSALDIEKFKESMKLVAPIASAAGVSIEEATAMLGALANAGISGSMAGTSLRRILNEVAKTGKPVAEALAEMSEKGLTLADAEDEVGKNAQTALLVLSKQMGTVNELTEVYKKADGTAKAMAETQDNTLGGSIARLISKWQEFIIKLSQSSGAGATLRKVIDFLANNLENILNVIIKVSQAFVAYKIAVQLMRAQTELLIISEQIRGKGLMSLFQKQTTLNAATKTGAEVQKNYNAVAKNLMLSGILIFIGNLAAAWYDVASGAKNARLQEEAYQRAQALGQEKASKFVNEQSKKMEKELMNLRKLGLSEEELQKQRETIQSKYIKDSLLRIGQIQKEKKNLEAQALILEQVNKATAGAKTPETLLFLEEKGLKAQKSIEESLNSLGLQVEDQEDSWMATEGSFTRFARAGKAGVKELDAELEALRENTDTLKTGLNELIIQDLEMQDFSKDFKNQNNEIKEQVELLKQVETSGLGLEFQLEQQAKLQKQLNDELEISGGSQTAITKEIDAQLEQTNEIIRILRNARETVGNTDQLDTRGVKSKDQLIKEEQERLDDLAQKEQERLDDLAQKEQERLDAQKQIAQNLTDLTVMLANRRIEALERENQIQQQIFEQSMNREQQIISMREANNSSLESSLAFEKEAQAKALQEQSKIAKKKARIEMFMNGMQLLNSYVQQGKGVGNVIGDMTALTSALEQIVPAFWTGTDTTVGDAVGVKYSNKRDGVLARIDPSEMVLNKTKVDTLAKYGVNSTDDIVRRVQMGSMFNVPSVTSSKPIIVNNQELERKIDSTNALLQQIAQKPTSQLDIEQLDRLVTISETISTPTKRVTTVKHKRLGR